MPIKVYDGSQWVQVSDGTNGTNGTNGADGGNSFTTKTESSSYTLVSSDLGKLIIINGNDVTIPNNVFSAGDVISIFNKGGNAGIQTSSLIPATNVTARLGGSNITGTTKIHSKGIANIICTEDVNNADVFIVTGQGVSQN